MAMNILSVVIQPGPHMAAPGTRGRPALAWPPGRRLAAARPPAPASRLLAPVPGSGRQPPACHATHRAARTCHLAFWRARGCPQRVTAPGADVIPATRTNPVSAAGADGQPLYRLAHSTSPGVGPRPGRRTRLAADGQGPNTECTLTGGRLQRAASARSCPVKGFGTIQRLAFRPVRHSATRPGRSARPRTAARRSTVMACPNAGGRVRQSRP